jgi:peptidoglycan/LPS O-acetylase OafA/YrhL
MLWVSGNGSWGSRILATLYLSMVDISFALIVFGVIRYCGGNAWWLRVLRSGALRWVGRISYTLYLVNYPVLKLTQYAVADLHLPRRASAVSETLGAFVISLMISGLSWRFIEARALRLKDRVYPALGLSAA